MNKVLLWLDDYRNPYNSDWLIFSPIEKPFTIVWVRSFDEFVKYIKSNGLPQAICFDHDLGEEKTGYDCARWLVEYCLNNNIKEFPLYSSQSANPVGRENILSLLNNFVKEMITI